MQRSRSTTGRRRRRRAAGHGDCDGASEPARALNLRGGEEGRCCLDTHSFGRRNWTEHGRTRRARTLTRARLHGHAGLDWTGLDGGGPSSSHCTGHRSVVIAAVAAAAAVLYSFLSADTGAGEQEEFQLQRRRRGTLVLPPSLPPSLRE